MANYTMLVPYVLMTANVSLLLGLVGYAAVQTLRKLGMSVLPTTGNMVAVN